MPSETVETSLTKLFGIQYPIILAGMNKAAGPKLAAAVTNSGGLGVIGGVFYTPRILRSKIRLLKKNLNDPNAPFGVDLLIPKVGVGARATNYDYTKGGLDELVDIIIAEGAKLFVSAVGVPPVHIVKKFHDAGIPVMNMIGAPKHVKKCLAVGVDIICAQGGEGGGHTGDVATSILIPAVVDLVKKSNAVSPLTGQPVRVVAAGGIRDGRGLASALCMGADAVWVGTRFVAAKEAGASEDHKQSVLKTGYHGTVRTLIFTGRPMRVARNPYIDFWENHRAEEIKKLCKEGIIPYESDVKRQQKRGKKGAKTVANATSRFQPHLMGQVAGSINDILPANQIMEEMMTECISVLKSQTQRVCKL